MFRYLKALWYAITGRFTAAAEALQSNKNVMRATYDQSIKKSEERFQTVRDAVAELMGIEQTRLQEIKALQEKEGKLEKVKKGAHAAMQRCIKQLQGHLASHKHDESSRRGLLMLVGMIAWAVVTWRLVADNGWTLGKRACSIRVVRSDGSDASVGRIFFHRNCIIALLQMIPFLGSLIGIADPLFIFGDRRQCLHDRIADTIVVQA